MTKVHQHALINQKKKKLRPNDVLVRPTEKVSGKTSGKNESRALIINNIIIIIIIYVQYVTKFNSQGRRKREPANVTLITK